MNLFLNSRLLQILPLLLITSPGMLTTSDAADWFQFRGPGGLGASQETGIPTRWSKEDNIQWRAELPGPGTSSPIVVGDRVYLTSYSGYAEQVEVPGQLENLKRHLVAIHRETGEILFVRDFKPVLPESTYSGGNNARHGYSSSTPISDGRSALTTLELINAIILAGFQLLESIILQLRHSSPSPQRILCIGKELFTHNTLLHVNSARRRRARDSRKSQKG